MSAHNQNIKADLSNFRARAGELAPDWLYKLGLHLNMGVLIIGPDDRIVLFNEAFIEHCGFPAHIQESAKYFREWLVFMEGRGDFPDDISGDRAAEFLREIHQGNFDRSVLSNIAPPNGKALEFRCLDSGNGIISIFSEDVTSKKRNEESLKLALEIGKSGYFYHVFDTQETHLESEYLQRLMTEEEFQSLKQYGFWKVIHQDDREKARTLWRNSVLNGKSLEFPARIVTRNNGTLTFKFTIKPVKSSTGSLLRVIGFFEDVTHEYKIRKALQNAKEETETSLKSKTDFLARISHEIRTPMNAVIGIADALIHHNKNPAIVPKLELIQSSADGILNTLDATLHHAKLSSDEFVLDPKPGDPRHSIRNICALWETKAAENDVTIQCTIESSVPETITYDKYRYEQCLNNLLSNAIKFSPGGTISVLATRIDKNGQSYMVLAVRDSGIGMSEEQTANIFQPFKQGDKSIAKRFGGTGLGMNITRSLIEKMGGHISVKSQLGKGTIFVLNLPIQKEDIAPLEPDALIQETSDHPVTTPYERLKVLVADDNPTNHLVVKSLLDGVVAEVVTAIDGQEALSVLETQPIDIILMDIHMPVMDGIEATLAIRSAQAPWSDVIIIALTADPEYQQKRLCMNIGMDFAVAKPVKLVDLMDAFDQVLPLRNSQMEYRKTA